MKFTLSWLRDHLDSSASLDDIITTLTAIGLEVESVTDNAAALAPFIVAQIEEAIQHPQADKLRVCKVNDGSSIRQVVCGAPNARAGIKVVLATEGVKIPANGLVIKKSAIRGVESNGMLCSAAELGLSTDSGGIIELPANAKLGVSAASILGADDPMIEIAVTPNRADCLSVYGIARDLAAAGLGTFRPSIEEWKSFDAQKFYGREPFTYASPTHVTINTDGCQLFVGCTIRNMDRGPAPSPELTQTRLKAIGLRPISMLVDETNYSTYNYGRPLHVYDAKKLKGDIVVRNACDGEIFLALNHKEYTLSSDMVVICDDSGVIGLAGVMGGLSTAVSEDTTDIFLESALFDPVAVANAGRTLGIDSDARYRFERGVDPEAVKVGAEMAAASIYECCGGDVSQWVVAGEVPTWKREISFNFGKVKTLGGMSLSRERIETLLKAAGCTINENNVTPPSWRKDIEGEADLVEEVLRLSGYNAIPSADLPYAPKASLTPQQQRVSAIRRTLALQGMSEIYSWAFLPLAQAQQFGGGGEALQLLNPISADLDTMRPSLLPGLLTAVASNANRGFRDSAFFEIGNIYRDTTPQGQKLAVAGIRIGKTVPRNSFKTERAVDIYDIKADLLAALAAAGLSAAKLPTDRNAPAWYHPARSGRLLLGKTPAGTFGEIHPELLAAFGIEQSVVAFEMLLEAMPAAKTKAKAKPSLVLSNFQTVERDFAFIAADTAAASDIVKAVESADKILIRAVSIFDIYAGQGVEQGKKSIALSVTLQASDRTLTESEIEAVAHKIIAAAASLGLTLRS